MGSFQFTSQCQTSASRLSNAEGAVTKYIPQSSGLEDLLCYKREKTGQRAIINGVIWDLGSVGCAASGRRASPCRC